MATDKDGFSQFGFGEPPDPPPSTRSAEEMGWLIETAVEQAALRFYVPFKSSDVAAAVGGISYQKATHELEKLGWDWSDAALLQDGTRGRRWLPQVVDRDIVDDREDVSCWSELHEDDQRKTWDERGD